MSKILLVYVSMYPVDKYTKEVIVPAKETWYGGMGNDYKVSAPYTNVGPAALLYNAEKIEKVFTIKSDSVREKERGFGKDSGISFEDKLKGIIKNIDGGSIELIPFDISDQPDDKEILEVVSKIGNAIDNKDELYVDLSGGQRQVAILLEVVSKIVTLKGTKLCGTLTNSFNSSVNYTESSPLEVIMNTSTGHAIDFYSALKLFCSTGKINALREVIDDYEDNSDLEKGVLDVMDKFYSSLLLCQVDTTVKLLFNVINEIEKYEKSYESNNPLFMLSLDILKDRMGLEQLDNDGEKNNKDMKNVKLLVKWCMKYNLLQQAITIFNERIPKYLFKDTELSKPINKLLYGKGKRCDTYDEVYNKRIEGFKKYGDEFIRQKKFFTYYLFINSIRDHINHASEEEQRSNIDKYLQIFMEDELTKDSQTARLMQSFQPGIKITDVMGQPEIVKRALEEALDILGDSLYFDKI